MGAMVEGKPFAHRLMPCAIEIGAI